MENISKKIGVDWTKQWVLIHVPLGTKDKRLFIISDVFLPCELPGRKLGWTPRLCPECWITLFRGVLCVAKNVAFTFSESRIDNNSSIDQSGSQSISKKNYCKIVILGI